MIFDPALGLVVGGVAHGTLPHLDRLVLETCALIEDCQVLECGEVAGLKIDRGLELVDGLVDVLPAPVEKTKMIMQLEGERIDADPALEVGDRAVQVAALVGLDPGGQGFPGRA